MANVFKQYRDSKISDGILLKAASTPTLQSPIVGKKALITDLRDPSVDLAMLVFIVESSTRGGAEKIDTVRSVVGITY